MKKYLVLIFIAVLSAVASYSQNNFQDVVYLKNGDIIRGIIIEQVPNKSLKIETADKSVFNYKMEEIEKFTKEQVTRKKIKSNDLSGLNSKYKKIIEIGYQIGIGENDVGVRDYDDRLKLNIINGYQIKPYLSLGIGTGLRYYKDWEDIVIPVFADFRTNLLNKNKSPYLSLGIGYSFNASAGSFKGTGLLFNPTVGVNFKVSDRSLLSFGIGYELQKVELSYDYLYYDNMNKSSWKHYSGSKNFDTFDINVGFSF